MTMATGRSALPDNRSWEDMKERIIRLYLGEQRTLREVKSKMESQYGFKATYAKPAASFVDGFWGVRVADWL